MNLDDHSMKTDQAKLPQQFLYVVIGLTLLPGVLQLIGFRLSTSTSSVSPLYWLQEDTQLLHPFGILNYLVVKQVFVYSLLEWTAFCIATVTAVFSLVHYHLKRDLVTPVIGAALLFSGMIDAFHVLATMRLISPAADATQFIPFTWTISRLFNVLIIIAGTSSYLRVKDPYRRRDDDTVKSVLIAVLFGIAAYSIIFICAFVPRLPDAIFSSALIPRPYDAAALILYLMAGGIVLPRFCRNHPSLFAYGLLVSVIPHVAAQMHVTFGARSTFDADVYFASYLKIIACLVPLVGLILDYRRAYKTEAELAQTRQTLQVAQSVQEGLLPRETPVFPGFDLAGHSVAATIVGGDFYDYIPMKEGRLGVAVADVSGHEIGAALVMAQARAFLRALGPNFDRATPMLAKLNHFLAADVRESRFVCFLFACLHPDNSTITFSSIGHVGYLVKADGTVVRLDQHCPPLGVVEDDALPAAEPTALSPGDLVCLVTDGILETESPHGDAFGEDRTQQTIIDHRQESADEIVKAVITAVDVFSNHSPQVDDCTIVVIKRLSEGEAGTSS